MITMIVIMIIIIIIIYMYSLYPSSPLFNRLPSTNIIFLNARLKKVTCT